MQAMLHWLRDDGLPLAAIARAIRVNQKSIYAWMDTVTPRERYIERIFKIYNLLNEDKQSTLKSLYRLWNKQVNGCSLRYLFSQETLDEHAIRETLKHLWPLTRK